MTEIKKTKEKKRKSQCFGFSHGQILRQITGKFKYPKCCSLLLSLVIVKSKDGTKKQVALLSHHRGQAQHISGSHDFSHCFRHEWQTNYYFWPEDSSSSFIASWHDRFLTALEDLRKMSNWKGANNYHSVDTSGAIYRKS